MSRTRSINDKQIAEVIRMKKDGMSHQQVFEVTGIPATSISRILRQHGMGKKREIEQKSMVSCHLEMFINQINAVLC